MLFPLTASACSSDDSDETNPAATAATAASVVADPVGPEATVAPVQTVVPTEPAAAAEGGDCSTVPSEDVVEAIIGSPVLPVEEQSVGCVYLGDGNNVGVYFEILTDEFDISNFDNPDAQFATTVEDPGLPPGSFVQSGDFYAKKNGVLHRVSAGVSGTEDDDQLATQLMIAWLALVP